MTVSEARKVIQQKLTFGDARQVEALALIRAADELLKTEVDIECPKCYGDGCVRGLLTNFDIEDWNLKDIQEVLKEELCNSPYSPYSPSL